MNSLRSVAFAAIGLLALAPADAVTAPTVSVRSFDDLDVPSWPFDAHADAEAALDAAFARARLNGKRVLIDLGANWCADCRILAGVMELPEVKTFLNAHYEVVSVDVGRVNRNLEIPKRFGIALRFDGVPAVLAVSADGRLINAGHVSALADSRRMTPQGLADWLAEWTN